MLRVGREKQENMTREILSPKTTVTSVTIGLTFNHFLSQHPVYFNFFAISGIDND